MQQRPSPRFRTRKPRTPEQIHKIAAQVTANANVLPPLTKGRIWALTDSGAEPHAAPYDVFKSMRPDLVLVPTTDGDGNYAAANGTAITSKSGGVYFTVHFKTLEGHDRSITYRDANIPFPINSTGRIADCGNTNTYGSKGGRVTSEITGEEDGFIRALGVYWMEMIVNDPALQIENNTTDFHRQE